MPRRVLVQRESDHFDLVEVQSPDEHALQEVMKAQVQLIPSDDLGLDGDLLVVGRETTLASGKIDLLCLSRSGDLVLIEFKTGPQNPDFRHALAQLIDYGSDLWRLNLEDFDRGVVQRYLTSPHCVPLLKGANDLRAAIARTAWKLSGDDEERLYDRLARVLTTGDFIYVVAAQRFTAAMTTSLEYLNATLRYGRFYLMELVRLQGQDLVAHAAQIVATPTNRGPVTQTPASGQANEADFLAQIPADDYREAIRDILATAITLGMAIHWGSKGASIRIRTPDRNEPLSIGWVFLEGDQWFGARHLTFGVDLTTLANTPSVRQPVEVFIEQVRAIYGAKPVPTKLNAYTFEPHILPTAKDALIEVLEALVQAIQGTQ